MIGAPCNVSGLYMSNLPLPPGRKTVLPSGQVDLAFDLDLFPEASRYEWASYLRYGRIASLQ